MLVYSESTQNFLTKYFREYLELAAQCSHGLGMTSSEELPLTTMVLKHRFVFWQALKDPRQNWICDGSGLARHAVPVACM